MEKMISELENVYFEPIKVEKYRNDYHRLIEYLNKAADLMLEGYNTQKSALISCVNLLKSFEQFYESVLNCCSTANFIQVKESKMPASVFINPTVSGLLQMAFDLISEIVLFYSDFHACVESLHNIDAKQLIYWVSLDQEFSKMIDSMESCSSVVVSVIDSLVE